MKQLAWLSLIALVATNALAQRRGGFAGGVARGGAHGSFVRGGPRPRFGSRIVGGFNQRFGRGFFGDFYPYALPVFDDAYEFGYPFDIDYPFSPSIAQPARPIIIRQAPPPVVSSVINNYNVGVPAPTSAGAEEPTFVLALTDGSRLSATAVWVQDGVVHYIDTDDRSLQVPITSVERELTRKLNQERNLNLRLPPPQ